MLGKRLAKKSVEGLAKKRKRYEEEEEMLKKMLAAQWELTKGALDRAAEAGATSYFFSFYPLERDFHELQPTSADISMALPKDEFEGMVCDVKREGERHFTINLDWYALTVKERELANNPPRAQEREASSLTVAFDDDFPFPE